MGRPSKTSQRRAEILDAFETCVLQYGLDGTNLEHIAAESGLARPLIRHHAGNRDALITALTTRYFEKSAASLQALQEALPDKARSKALIAILFDETLSDARLARLAEAMIMASTGRPALAEQLSDWARQFHEIIAAEIHHDYPLADKTQIDDVAIGITGLYFNTEAMAVLKDLTEIRESSKRAALTLLASLPTSPKAQSISL